MIVTYCFLILKFEDNKYNAYKGVKQKWLEINM